MGCRESDQEEVGKNEPVGREPSPAGLTADPAAQSSLWARLSVRSLGLSPATNHALERFGQTTVGQIIDLSDTELLQNPHLTPRGVAEIRRALQRLAAPFPLPDILEVTEQSSRGPEPTPDLASTSVSLYASSGTVDDMPAAGSPVDPPTELASPQPCPTPPAHDPLPVPVGELGFSEQTILALHERGIFTLGYFADPASFEIPFLKGLDSRAIVEVWEALTSLFHISAAIVADLDTIQISAAAQSQKVTSVAPLEALDLPRRCHNALMRAGYDCVEQLLVMNDDELLEVRNLGRQSLADLRHALDNYISDHPGQGPIRVIDTRACVESNVRWRVFHPAHNPLTQVHERTWLMMLESGQSWDSVKALDLELRAKHLPFLVPLPADTIVGRESVSFLLRMGCPLAEISSARLTISKPARDYLKRTGLTTALRVFLADGTQFREDLAADAFEALVSDVSYYVQWLAAQSDWADEVKRRRPSPTALFHLAREDWECLLNSLLATLEDRECMTLNLRYGLDGASALTLQEVADKLTLTRARVQQIEAKALRRLQGRLVRHEVLGAFVWLCQEAIKGARISSASALLAELSEYLPPDSRLNRGQVRLLIEGVSECARYQAGLDLFVYALTRLEVHFILHAIRRVLRAAGAPMRFSNLVGLMQQNSPIERKVDAELIRTCLQAVPDFVNVEDDFWGLESWERHIGDNLVMILRRLGHPAHFSELARELNERLPTDTRKSERNVLTHLRRLTNLFIRTGPGTFGLRENYPDLPSQPTKYVDLIEQVLREAGRPLHVDEVFRLVNERREARRSSIQIYLSMDPRFVKLGPAQYGLAIWHSTTQPRLAGQEPKSEPESGDVFTEELKQQVLRWLQQGM